MSGKGLGVAPQRYSLACVDHFRVACSIDAMSSSGTRRAEPVSPGMGF